MELGVEGHGVMTGLLLQLRAIIQAIMLIRPRTAPCEELQHSQSLSVTLAQGLCPAQSRLWTPFLSSIASFAQSLSPGL